MRLVQSTLVTVMALLVSTVAAAAPEQKAAVCAAMLEAAEKVSSEAHRGSEAVQLYTAAFDVCASADLSAELEARVAARRGEVLHLYRNDPGAAIEVYEAGLAALSTATGPDHPARIDLLDGLAGALESRAARSEGPDSVKDRSRSIELRKESLAVRRAAFGMESEETVRGLLLLGFCYLPEEPHLAEGHVAEAVAIAVAHPAMIEPGAEAYSALAEIYRQQGREREALAASEQAGELFARAYPSGEPN